MTERGTPYVVLVAAVKAVTAVAAVTTSNDRAGDAVVLVAADGWSHVPVAS